MAVSSFPGKFPLESFPTEIDRQLTLSWKFIRLVQLALGVFHLGIFGYMLERSKDLLQINITDPGSDIIVLMEMFESYLDSEGPESIMNLFTAAFIITWVIISFILFFTGLLLPLAVILIDALCFVFLFASIICVSEYGFTKCTTLQQYNNLELICILRKGHFSALVISM